MQSKLPKILLVAGGLVLGGVLWIASFFVFGLVGTGISKLARAENPVQTGFGWGFLAWLVFWLLVYPIGILRVHKRREAKRWREDLVKTRKNLSAKAGKT
jgi:hypothetical protein